MEENVPDSGKDAEKIPDQEPEQTMENNPYQQSGVNSECQPHHLETNNLTSQPNTQLHQTNYDSQINELFRIQRLLEQHEQNNNMPPLSSYVYPSMHSVGLSTASNSFPTYAHRSSAALSQYTCARSNTKEKEQRVLGYDQLTQTTQSSTLTISSEYASKASNTMRSKEHDVTIGTVKLGTVEGKKCYTVHLNGQKIPLDTFKEKHVLEQGIVTSSVQATSLTSTSSTSIAADSKPKFRCETCGKSYVRSRSYYAHLREHSDIEKEFKCSFCSISFSVVEDLKQHLLLHTEGSDFSCTICDKTFTNASSLQIHQLTHAEGRFACEHCEKKFSSASCLRVHQRTHQIEKPFVCMHGGCKKAFKTASELSRHAFRHTGEKPYKCDQCTKSFIRNDDLKRHYFIHTGQKRFKCDQCDFSCIQSFDLVKHKYVHTGEKPYKCQVCSKTFARPVRLKEHMRVHTGEKAYKCDLCGKCFNQNATFKAHQLTHQENALMQCLHCPQKCPSSKHLESHISTVHNKPDDHVCTVCNKTFVSAITLKRHAIIHSGEKPFECSICKRRFTRECDMKLHMRVHDDEKPFKCSQCEKTFTRFSSLKEHARLHTGELPFKCETCGKVFNHRSHLNIHMRTHTGEKPYSCHVCNKDFARKSSLLLHIKTHTKPIKNENSQEECAFQNPCQSAILQTEPKNPCLTPSRKRKHEGDYNSDHNFMLKRPINNVMQLSEFNQQIEQAGNQQLKIGDLSVFPIDSLINNENTDSQKLVTMDGNTVVNTIALNLTDLQPLQEIERINEDYLRGGSPQGSFPQERVDSFYNLISPVEISNPITVGGMEDRQPCLFQQNNQEAENGLENIQPTIHMSNPDAT